MKKIILKITILSGILFLINFLPKNSIFVNFLLIAIFIFLIFLLIIIFLALESLTQGFGLHGNRKKIKNKSEASPYLKIKYKNIEVSYLKKFNGGGILFAYEFVHIISQKIAKVEHVFEYCAGPGFIGFSLLANNLCDRLSLADTNPEAIEAIKETIKNNNLGNKVTVYQSDCLDSIPENEQWDLVVSNPPWDLCSKNKKNIKVHDSESRVHKKFYQNVNKFLKPDGSILFIEGGEYTHEGQFKNMIERNGLRIIESFKSVPFLKIFKNMSEYQGLRIPLVIFLRICLFAREAYFIWSKKEVALNALNIKWTNGINKKSQ